MRHLCFLDSKSPISAFFLKAKHVSSSVRSAVQVNIQASVLLHLFSQDGNSGQLILRPQSSHLSCLHSRWADCSYTIPQSNPLNPILSLLSATNSRVSWVFIEMSEHRLKKTQTKTRQLWCSCATYHFLRQTIFKPRKPVVCLSGSLWSRGLWRQLC